MKFGANQSAMRTAAVGALLFSAIAALTLSPLVSVVAADRQGSGQAALQDSDDGSA